MNNGLGAFCADVFAELRDGVACYLAMVYKRLLSTNELTAFEVSERYYEIGSLQGIEEAAEYLRRESAKQ